MYRFPIRRSARPDIKSYSLVKKETEAEEIGLIYGRTPGSVQEWRVAVALWTMDADFTYQYTIRNRRPSGARGIFSLDFLIDASPKPLGLEVQSKRWHGAQFSPNEKLRIAMIERLLKSKLYFIWGFQLTDQKTATENVRSLVGPYL